MKLPFVIIRRSTYEELKELIDSLDEDNIFLHGEVRLLEALNLGYRAVNTLVDDVIDGPNSLAANEPPERGKDPMSG